MYNKREFAVITPGEDGVNNVVGVSMFEDPTTANNFVKLIYDEHSYAIDCSQFAIELPAAYRDGGFVLIKKIPKFDTEGNILEYETKEYQAPRVIPPLEMIDNLQKQNKELLSNLADVIGGALK